MSPCNTFRFAGESCGVSRGVNWLTPGTSRDHRINNMEFWLGLNENGKTLTVVGPEVGRGPVEFLQRQETRLEI